MMIRPPRQGRLEPSEAQLIDRSRVVAFEFDGWPIKANEGDTIASAMYAAGIRTFSRSFKYHRGRGLLCVAGRCFGCMMTVDGVPNVRVCTEPARNGVEVRHQGGWPSLETDLLSILDRLDGFLPDGFYYKALHRPERFWRMVRPIVRRVAESGSVEIEPATESRDGHESRQTDVAVVGGGPAGISAAVEAAASGAEVVLIDDQPFLGGHLRFDARTYRDVPGFEDLVGYKIADSLAQAAGSAKGIEVLSSATALGLYEDNLLDVFASGRKISLRARRIVVAAGSYEVPLTFDRNDLPGVMLSTGTQRLMHVYGVRPGSTAVVATCGDQGYYAAVDLLDAGVRIAALVDSRPEFPHQLDPALALRSRGVLILPSYALTRAEGRQKLVGATAARFVDGRPTTEEREFDCDLVAISGGFQPASSLLQQAGCEMAYDPALDETVPQRLPSNVYSAGEVTGIHDLRASILQGQLAGLEASTSLARQPADGTDVKGIRSELTDAVASYRNSGASPPVELDHGAKQFVCFCRDVTARDVAHAVDQGFEGIEALGRYTAATTGPCQGMVCLKTCVAVCAQQTGHSVGETDGATPPPAI